MKVERRTATSSLDVTPSSSESAYCSRRYITSTAPVIAADRVFGDALQDALDIVGQEANKTDAVITKARQEINELKNRQALTENVLNRKAHPEAPHSHSVPAAIPLSSQLLYFSSSPALRFFASVSPLTG